MDYGAVIMAELLRDDRKFTQFTSSVRNSAQADADLWTKPTDYIKGSYTFNKYWNEYRAQIVACV